MLTSATSSLLRATAVARLSNTSQVIMFVDYMQVLEAVAQSAIVRRVAIALVLVLLGYNLHRRFAFYRSQRAARLRYDSSTAYASCAQVTIRRITTEQAQETACSCRR